MSRPRYLHPLFIFLALWLTSLSYPLLVNAASSCNVAPENKDSALYFSAINDPNKDCAADYNLDSEISYNNISGLEPTCSDDPTFVAQFEGSGINEPKNIPKEDGTGTTTVDLMFSKNFAHDNATVAKNAQNITPYGGTTTLSDFYDSSYYYNDCVFRKINSHLACSIARGTALVLLSGKKIYNSFMDSNEIQRTSLPGYIDKKFNLKAAERQITCIEDPASREKLTCWNKYASAPGEDSYGNAQFVVGAIREDTPVSALLAKPITQQWSIRAMGSKEQSSYWVALLPKKDLLGQDGGTFDILKVLSAEQKTEVLRKGQIPINFLAEVKDIFLRNNLPGPGAKALASINSIGVSDEGGDTYREKIVNKILKVFPTNSCTPIIKKVNFNGSKADSRSMVDKGLLNWIIKFWPQESETEGKEHKVYTAYVLVSKEVRQLAHLIMKNDNAFERKYYLPKIDKWLEANKQIDSQQTIYRVTPQGKSKEGSFWDELDKYFCGDENRPAWCPKEKPKWFDYEGGGAKVNLKDGGVGVISLLDFNARIAELPTSDLYMDKNVTCYYPALEKRVAGTGTILSDALHLNLAKSDSPEESDCPAYISYDDTSSNKPANENDICAVADEYDIPCCQLKGIMAQETGYGTDDYSTGSGFCTPANISCCNGIGCGPAQLTCGQILGFQGGEDIDACSPIGAAELLARAMKLKMCQADGKCLTYDWAKEKLHASTYFWGDGDYTAAAYFNGLGMGCATSGCSQYRWGAGKTYCDSIDSFCQTGQILPLVRDMNFCDACNIELVRSGLSPRACN